MRRDFRLNIPEGGYIYDGEAKTPELLFGGYEKLEEGVDYNVTYLDNVNAGTASVIVEALDKEKTNGIRILNFKIEQRSIEDVEIEVDDKGYAKPNVSVSFGGKKLVKGVDYKVEYVLNAKKNTVIVNIEGIGNFKNVASYTREVDTSFIGSINSGLNDIRHFFNDGGIGPILVISGGILLILLIAAIAAILVV